MARLTRDFSGKHGHGHGGAFRSAGRPLAYGIPVAAQKAAGERIGLLLVSVDDWHGAEYLVERPAVARVVAPADLDLADADWSVAAGLDVLVCGDCPPERFAAAVVCCLRAGAASVWGEFAEGMQRLDFWPHGAPWYVSAGALVPDGRFGSAVQAFRETALLLGDGFYGHAAFAPMRAALLERCGL